MIPLRGIFVFPAATYGRKYYEYFNFSSMIVYYNTYAGRKCTKATLKTK